MASQYNEKNNDLIKNECLAKVNEIIKKSGIQLNESLVNQLDEYCFTKDTIISKDPDNVIICTKVECLTIQLNIHANGECDRICWAGIM